MAIYLFAFVLAGGMAVGDIGAKASADKFAPPATAEDLRMEKAARDYRIQTYETFHKDRAEYDRRQAEAARLQAAWTEAGSNEGEQPKLIGWLNQATACSRSDAIGELPAAPKFTVMPPKKTPEKTLVEATKADSVPDAAAKVDGLLHVTPTGATTAATNPSAAAAQAKGGASPQFKPSLIGSLPKAFEAEINRTLQGLSGKPAPKAP